MLETTCIEELEINDELFFRFSELIYGTAGIKLSPQKKGLLVSRLIKRLKRLSLKNLSDYYHKVKEDSEELIEMLNCICTNTTKFFREIHHFEYLKNTVIPFLLKNKSDEKVIRIWSAGCSTGEEPYSIAIAVCEAVGKLLPSSLHQAPLRGWDVKILATDISTKVLETAQSAVYEYEQLPEGMNADSIASYFSRGIGENDGKIKAKDLIRSMIQFRRLNLKDRIYPFKKKFDLIFCRNVMIYFDDSMKRHVISKFHHHLTEGGHLFLGHSETMFGRDEFVPANVTVYRKV